MDERHHIFVIAVCADSEQEARELLRKALSGYTEPSDEAFVDEWQKVLPAGFGGELFCTEKLA